MRGRSRGRSLAALPATVLALVALGGPGGSGERRAVTPWTGAAWAQADARGTPPDRRYSTVERLSDARLAATHDSGDRLREAVARPEPLPGLTDYRAIFHAHAADADHTGGTFDELVDDAKRAGVRILFLSDHPRPPRDFLRSGRGLHEDVLVIPGAELQSGYLVHPETSVMSLLDGPLQELLAASTRGRGLAFLSHLEDHDTLSFDGLTGTEIYNRHADAKDEAESLRALAEWMTDPAGVVRLRNAVSRHPVEIYAAQQDYPAQYLAAWDRATASGLRLVGIAANDCHHNQVFVVKKIDDRSARVGTVVDDDGEMRVFTADTRPRLPELLRNREPGDEVARLDFDPYWVSMRFVSTHVLAPALEEAAVRDAVRAGHVYVAHDWIADPTGFRFVAVEGDGGAVAIQGDETEWRPGLRLVAELALPARVRLLRDGVEIASERTRRLERTLDMPGVYRMEAFLDIAGETRPWIYSNPIHVRGSAAVPTQ